MNKYLIIGVWGNIVFLIILIFSVGSSYHYEKIVPCYDAEYNIMVDQDCIEKGRVLDLYNNNINVKDVALISFLLWLSLILLCGIGYINED
jgi:hypothetical protein